MNPITVKEVDYKNKEYQNYSMKTKINYSFVQKTHVIDLLMIKKVAISHEFI